MESFHPLAPVPSPMQASRSMTVFYKQGWKRAPDKFEADVARLEQQGWHLTFCAELSKAFRQPIIVAIYQR